jgi:hypothetical protein
MATPRTTKRIHDAFSLARHNRYADLSDIMGSSEHPFHPDTSDSKGNSILLVACQNGLKRILKLALKMGADPDHRNDAGNTALHFCFMYGFGSTLGAYLKEKGADDSLRNHRGHTCYDVTMRPGASGSGATTPDNDMSFESPSKQPDFGGIEEEEYGEEEVGEYQEGEVQFGDCGAVEPTGEGWESDYLNE